MVAVSQVSMINATVNLVLTMMIALVAAAVISFLSRLKDVYHLQMMNSAHDSLNPHINRQFLLNYLR